MAKINLRDLPATKNYMSDFIKKVFEPISSGQNNAIFAVPKAGCNSFIKYCLNYPEEIDRSISNFIKSTKWMLLELDGIEREKDFWESLRSKLCKEDKKVSGLAESTVKTRIKRLANENTNIVFIFNSSDKIFENQKTIKHAISSLYSGEGFVKFLFVFYEEHSKSEIQSLFSSFLITSSSYIKLRDLKDMLVLLKKEERWYSYSLPSKTRSRIAMLAGGYPSLCRGILSLARRDYKEFNRLTDHDISTDSTVSIWLMKIYQSLSDNSKNQLKQIVTKPIIKLTDISKHLLNTGIIRYKENKIKLFSILFRHFIKDLSLQENPITIKNRKLFFSTVPLDILLSRQQFQVFKLLWSKRNNTVSREDIASTIWGKDWKSSYSDWAIDRLIYKIRNKIGDTKKEVLSTKKGKGFILNIK